MVACVVRVCGDVVGCDAIDVADDLCSSEGNEDALIPFASS